VTDRDTSPERDGALPSPEEGEEPVEARIADRVAQRGTPRGDTAERVLREISEIDLAVYRAIASTPSPSLDEPMRRLSNAANRSVLWLGIAGGLFVLGGRAGRRAAVAGVASIGVASATVNLGMKSLYPRERPDRSGAGVIEDRHVEMPSSTSFPSGHSASGFAFATAVGREIPALAFPLRLLAGAVAYSRVHTGVHYPGDTVAGSLVGGATGQVVGDVLSRLRARRA
jgi:membrane-associated phospholipid phosphatase